MMDEEENEPDVLTDGERAALEILKGAGVGRHVASPTLIGRWGSRGMLKALDALVAKGLVEANGDQFTFAAMEKRDA